MSHAARDSVDGKAGEDRMNCMAKQGRRTKDKISIFLFELTLKEYESNVLPRDFPRFSIEFVRYSKQERTEPLYNWVDVASLVYWFHKLRCKQSAS